MFFFHLEKCHIVYSVCHLVFLIFLLFPPVHLFFCVGLPKSSEQAYIEFESIEAIVKTASRTKFFIEFYSTCLEGEKNRPAPFAASHSHIHKSTSTDKVSVVDVIKLCFFFSYLSPSLPTSGSQYTFKLESIFDLCCMPTSCPPCTV